MLVNLQLTVDSAVGPFLLIGHGLISFDTSGVVRVPQEWRKRLHRKGARTGARFWVAVDVSRLAHIFLFVECYLF